MEGERRDEREDDHPRKPPQIAGFQWACKKKEKWLLI